MPKTTKERIDAIFYEQLIAPCPGHNGIEGQEDIKPTHGIVSDLGADSLDEIELVMAFEEEFSIEIPDAICEHWETVNDVYQYLLDEA